MRRERRYAQIEQRLETFVKAQDARIGVAVIINGKDTVSVNGSKDFPMMSVFKFPQALAVADFCLKNNVHLSDSITIKADEVKENTWSPMMHTDAMIGHKTGTGDRNSQGRIMAVNDAGYIYLPDKTGYAITVFIADSAYDMNETSKIIADISEIVFLSLKN